MPKLNGIYSADFVIDKYLKQHNPRSVTKISLDEYKARVVNRVENNTWLWTRKMDHIWFKNENVVTKIETPILKFEKSNLMNVNMKLFCNE